MKKVFIYIAMLICLATAIFSGLEIVESLSATNNSELINIDATNKNNAQNYDNTIKMELPQELKDAFVDANGNLVIPSNKNTQEENPDTIIDIPSDVEVSDVPSHRPILDMWTATDAWKEVNDKTTATITIQKVKDEPIVTTPDNQNEYLYKNIKGEKQNSGTLFTAYDASLGVTNVTTVFGHTMKNETMFGQLKKFKKLDYLKENPTFSMTSATSEYNLKIIAVANVSSNYADMGWYYAKSNLTEKEFENFKKEVRYRSYFVIPDEFDYESKYVILSCCDYAFSGERLIVVARIMDTNETVDVSTYAKNKLVLRANEFYRTYDQAKPSAEKLAENYSKNYAN